MSETLVVMLHVTDFSNIDIRGKTTQIHSVHINGTPYLRVGDFIPLSEEIRMRIEMIERVNIRVCV